MEFKVDDGGDTYRVDHSKVELANAQFPLVRQVEIVRTVAAAPATAVETGGWIPALPGTVGRFTAVGYFFARDIYHAVGVPVGIVLSAWGGTPVEAWMSDAARAGTAYDAAINDWWRQELAAWPPERVAQYPALKAAWEKAAADAAAHHTRNPLPWPAPPADAASPNRPGTLYNGMIAPLLPLAVRGVLWYQGESNAGRAREYAELFGALITSWRNAFGQGALPFYFVQLANFGEGANAGHRDWALLRDAQTQTLRLPATGMAVTVDIGDADNIHPRNKQEVGRRLALIARANVYHLPPVWQGPQFLAATPEGAALRVHFTHAGDELAVHGEAVTSLELAGADRVFHPATGKIETDTLLVSSPDVPAPVAVRYAWVNAPAANLYSDDGLPAVPFRSDSW
jgi:sialate O-acetylesterase